MEEDIKTQNLNSDSTKETSIEDDGSWILDLIDLSGLDSWPEHLQTEAKEMLKRNARVFSKTDMDMGRTNLIKHHIKLTDPVPFKEAYRKIPPQMYDEVKAHIQEMLHLGAIRPSNSPWASAIVLVRKKDGRLRFCIDLRRLNNKTVKDAYSLPKIESILDSLIGAQIFSTLDLKAGYWHIEMAEEYKAYTTFTCGPLGFYECDTKPFGATNAPATFQRLMHDCLGDLNMNWCICRAFARPPAFLPTTPRIPSRLEGRSSHMAPSGYRSLNRANDLGQKLDSSHGFRPQPIRGLPAIEPRSF